jgi:hypothetical protein
MGWFTSKPTQEQYLNSVIKVATNLYLNTIKGENGVSTNFQFELVDSKYRYLIFCCSAVFTTILAYDEKKNIQPEILFNGCIQFLKWAGNEYPSEYFETDRYGQYVENVEHVFQEFFKPWAKWLSLEQQGKNSEIVDLICAMIRSTESKKETEEEDINRLGELALEINGRLATINSAVLELAKKKQ